MVRKDNGLYSESIEIGRANQRLLPRVHRWCRHLEVEMASYGLLAQTTGLPIGHLRVKCQHGITTSESSFLASEARRFILRNCIGCSHHAEVGPDNYGREILAEKERADGREAAAAARRQELRQQAHGTAAAALETGRVTEASVNEFILGLFGAEEEAARCGQRLIEAASLGPELFSDAALDVLSDGFTGPQAEACITAVSLVCAYRKSVSAPLVTAAVVAVEQEQDLACGFLADSIAMGCDPGPALAALPAIVTVPRYGLFYWRHGLTHSRPLYPGTIKLLHTLFPITPDAVRAAMASRLLIDRKGPRHDAAEALMDLLPIQAERILPLVPILLRSLELTDDTFERSADAAVCRLISHLYAYAPDRVEADIAAYLPGAPGEVKELRLFRLSCG